MIQALQSAGGFDGWISPDPTLALFQKHFAIMHTLYRLREHYASAGYALHISPLSIELKQLPPMTARPLAGGVSAGGERVAEFYLDWTHFTAATPTTVTDLLTDFWRRFAAVDQKQAALQVLGLEPTADWSAVQANYRRLAAEHHPDKGGDSTRFTEIRGAYETLKRVYSV